MIKDAIVYPINNITALLTIIAMGVLIGLIAVLTEIRGFDAGSLILQQVYLLVYLV